jgi:hypothetical protein
MDIWCSRQQHTGALISAVIQRTTDEYPPSWHVSRRAATQTSRQRPVCHALQRRAGIEGLKRGRPCDVTGKIKSTLWLVNRERVAVIQHRPSRLFYCPTLFRTCYWVATLSRPAIITRAVAELASKSPEDEQIFHSPGSSPWTPLHGITAEA